MFYKLLFIMQSNEIQFTNIYYVMNIFQSHIYIYTYLYIMLYSIVNFINVQFFSSPVFRTCLLFYLHPNSKCAAVFLCTFL